MVAPTRAGDIRRRPFQTRLIAGALAAAVCAVLLGARLYHLQVTQHERYASQSDRNRLATRPVAPARGRILDRNGVVLAENVRSYVLVFTPALTRDLDALLASLGRGIRISARDRARLKRAARQNKYAPVALRSALSEDEAAWFAARAFEFDGARLDARWTRRYPNGATAAHVLGYIAALNQADLERLADEDRAAEYRGIDSIGRKGIEKTWESLLKGTPGAEQLEVTAAGRPVRVLRRIAPTPGADLVLSLDLGLQRVAEQALAGKRGAVVAIEPGTGAILALASAPSFDPNLFVDGIDEEDWRRLNESPDHPFVNRAIAATYPIGSTYKPFVALAALQLGVRKPQDRLPDPGYYEFGGQRFRNSEGAVFGDTDMRRALVVSSDTYFYSLGPAIGVDALHDFMRPFGFGQATGIDLDGERTGVLPSRRWKRTAFKHPGQQAWFAGESISLAVGQGYNSFTVLQLAQALATLVDNGAYRKPSLLRATRAPGADEPVPVTAMIDHQIALDRRNVDFVKSAMADVVAQGTARRAFAGAPYRAAGKTGTAQVFSLRGRRYDAKTLDPRLHDHALFTGFAPVEKPEIVVAVVVENGGFGAQAAAPIGRVVFDYWLSKRSKLAAPANG